MIKARMVSLGARVSMDLKRSVAEYCDRHGIKLQFFVAQALQQRLAEIQQEAGDNVVVDQRLQKSDFTSTQELKAYIQRRKKAN